MNRPRVWAILTGEYPPDIGGVSDYTHQIARGLVEAGDEVHVWSPRPTKGLAPCDQGITVHHLPDRYSPRSLIHLQSDLKKLNSDCRLLLQYTGSAFGLLGGNFAFGIWLAMQRKPAWVMFHELYMPLTSAQPMKHNVLAIAQRILLALVMRSTERVFVSIPNWAERLEPLLDGQSVTWLPIPSGVARDVGPDAPRQVRAQYSPGPDGVLLGHFGTYGRGITATLQEIMPILLRANAQRRLLLLGMGAEAYKETLANLAPDIASRVHATGPLSPEEVSAHLRACDLLIQPFPDGVSTRRSSLIAGLALGVPSVAPIGALTEPIWEKEKPIFLASDPASASMITAAEAALSDRTRLAASGERAKQFYRNFLDLSHTIRLLRS